MESSNDLELFVWDLDFVRQRMGRLIDAMAISAHLAIEREAETLRRSMGQRFRRVREEIKGANHGQ